MNAASRKVIIEAPAEPGTHLEVAYRPAGSFFPSYVQSGQQVDVGTTLIIDAYSDNPTKLPLVAVRVNGEEIEKFDKKLGELLPLLREDDLLILTADHGNDPTYTGTDHTREYVPFIAYSKRMKNGGAIKDEDTFAVIGASVAENFGVPMPEGTIGHSVLKELM